MRLSQFLSLALFSCLPTAVLAVPQYQLDQTSNTQNIKVTSYLVGSYNYLQRSNYFTSGVPDRIDDFAENGFRLQQAYLAVGMLPDEGLGAFTDMAAGLDAYTIAPYGWNADLLNLQNVGFAVRDAYLYYSRGSYTVIAGEMDAMAGFEDFIYLHDPNFSRGIIYGYVVPGVHAGVRGTKQLNTSAAVILGITNSWSTLRRPAQINGAELGMKLTCSDRLSMLIDAYLGNAYLTDFDYSGPTGRRVLLDWYGSYNATKTLSFNWNFDYAFQSKAGLPYDEIGGATWAAAAGYVNYQFNDKWRTAVRAEVMNDGNGYRTGVPQIWKELTLTFGYAPIKNVELLAETRHDVSNVDAFVNKSGAANGPGQQSYALMALYQIV